MVDERDVVELGVFVTLGVFAAPDVFVVEADFVLVEVVPVAEGLVVVCICVCANADSQRTPKLPASISAPTVP